MLGFTKSCFRGFVELSLWINLIICAIGGAMIGSKTGHAFLGFVIGVIVGMYSNMLYGGFIATFLNIDEKVENIDSNVYELKYMVEQQNRSKNINKSAEQEYFNKKS